MQRRVQSVTLTPTPPTPGSSKLDKRQGVPCRSGWLTHETGLILGAFLVWGKRRRREKVLLISYRLLFLGMDWAPYRKGHPSPQGSSLCDGRGLSPSDSLMGEVAPFHLLNLFSWLLSLFLT